MIEKESRIRSKNHLQFVASKPCIVCWIKGRTQSAHIRYPVPSINKGVSGVGCKPCDLFTVPLCVECHAEQHRMKEKKFWNDSCIDPIEEAIILGKSSPDEEIRSKAEGIRYERND